MQATGVHTTGQVIRVALVAAEGDSLRVERLQTLGAGSPPDSASSRGNQNGSACFSSLPAVEVLTRVWTLPAVAPSKLRALVSHRLEADLPIALDQLEWDCRAGLAPKAGEASVLAQAVRRDRLARHIDSLRAAELLPSTITTEAEAIASLAAYGLSLGGTDETTALVLAGEGEWLIAVLSGRLAQTVRRIPFHPADPDAAIRAASQVLDPDAAHGPVKQIAWIGQTDAAEPLQTLAEAFDLPLTVAVADLRDASGVPVAPAVMAEYGPAVGLALAALHDREHVIRLGGMTLEDASRPGNRLEAVLRYPKHLAVAVGVLLVLALGIQILSMRSETTRMQAELAVATSRPADDLDVKVRSMQRLTQYRIDVEAIMAEIARVLPDSTLITSVQLSRERRLVLKGTSKDAKAAFALADALRKSSRFEDVKPERAAPAQGGEFTITAQVTGIRKLTGMPVRGAAWR